MGSKGGAAVPGGARLADWVCVCCGEAQRWNWKGYRCCTCGDAICVDCVPGVQISDGLFCGWQCWELWKERHESATDG